MLTQLEAEQREEQESLTVLDQWLEIQNCGFILIRRHWILSFLRGEKYFWMHS